MHEQTAVSRAASDASVPESPLLLLHKFHLLLLLLLMLLLLRLATADEKPNAKEGEMVAASMA